MILYNSINLKIFSNSPKPTHSDILVVCFQYKLDEQRLDAPGFGEDFFHKQCIDAIFVNCATNEWWQYPELPEALSILQAFSKGWKRTITFGSSMGGYAAIRFAAAIGAKSSIAVGPQYSPRSSVIPGEIRYDAIVSHTKFLHECQYTISNSVTNYLIFDPLYSPDNQHVKRYGQEAEIVPIRIFCGGHTPTIAITQCGLLPQLLLQLFYDEFHKSMFRRLVRINRRKSSQYWKDLITHLLQHNKRIIALSVAKHTLGLPHDSALKEFAGTLISHLEPND